MGEAQRRKKLGLPPRGKPKKEKPVKQPITQQGLIITPADIFRSRKLLIQEPFLPKKEKP